MAVILSLLPKQSSSLANKYKALSFGTSAGDYISYTRDMSPFSNALTICMWIKRVDTSSSRPVVFHYQTSSETHEILIGAEGQFNRVVDDTVLENSHSYFQTPVGQWFSYCLTWSRSTNILQLYLNGQLARSGKTASENWRDLHTSGTLWFNRWGNSGDSPYIFGGQLFQLNMFSEVLSAETIRKIGQGGLCYDMEEVSSVPELKWEEVITQSRSGDVTEVYGCDSLDVLNQEIERLSGELKTTQTNLDSVTKELNTTQTNLDSVSTQLNQTLDELKKIRRCDNITRWDILFTSPFYNNFLTSELIEQLTSSWDMLGE